MGFAKERMMELDDLGLCPGEGGSVCEECVCDSSLAKHISQNLSECRCDYCGRESDAPIAASLEDVVEFMAEVIKEEWTDAANELPFETREGGYQGNAMDASDLLEEIGFQPESDELFEDVASYFGERLWCREDYFAATPAERHKLGWNRFCTEVKHVRRYTFWTSLTDGNPEYHPDYLPPGKMLSEIESVVTELGLIRQVPVGTRYWRVQDHLSSEKLEVPNRFTSPPLEHATQPNRMSPAGIPMFYGAEDLETAIREVVGDENSDDRAVTGVAFKTMRPLNILDLTFVVSQVSYFAPNGREWRHKTEFLRFFTKDVSKPIQRDGRQPIEYVPTQVFTEFVRFQLSAAEGHPVDGLRFVSSRTGRPCVVLFCDQDDCLRSRENRPQSLAYVPGLESTILLNEPRN